MTKLNTFIPSILIFAFLCLLNIFLPLEGDDYILLKESNGLQSIINSYYNWNARLYEMLYSGYIVRLNPYIFDIINAIIGASFIIGLFYLLCSHLPRFKSLSDMFILSLMLFLLCTSTAFQAIFLWGDGSVNYLWGGGGGYFHPSIF